jgi:hypothetical protein
MENSNISDSELPEMIAIQPKFKMGQVVATPGALTALSENKMSAWSLLSRHLAGDWGTVDEHDREANEQAIQDGSRILSAYLLPDQSKLWIITEAADDRGNRESTCVLTPDEY